MIRPYSLRTQLTPDRVTALLVTLAPLFYFFPAVRGRLVISPDDGVIFNIPLRVAAANLARAGYLPLWNPYIFCGMPLHGAAQAGVLFPLNWFYLIFNAPVATNLMMLSTYMVAGLGAYLYARRSGSSISGAALTSLVWQWSGFFIGQIGHTNILHTASLLPWLLWAVDGYGATGKRSRGILLSVLVAVQIFAGHQQTVVYSILVVAAYAVVMWRANRSKQELSQRSTQLAAYLWSLVFIAAGLGLAAVQILPTAELLRNSVRATSSYDFFTSFSLPPRFLWTFFAPYVFGSGDGRLFRAPYVGPDFYGEFIGYVGVATLALASLAVVLKRDTRTKFWFVVAVAGICVAFGHYWPLHLYAVIYYTPVLGLFRVPARHLLEVEFALAVLSGRGLTAVAAAQDRAKTVRTVLISGAVVFFLTCLAITLGRPSGFRLGRAAPVSIMRAPELFLPVVIAALSAWALWRFARRRHGAVVLLLGVIVLDLAMWGQSSGWRMSSPKFDSELWRTPETVQFLRERIAQDAAGGPHRILTQEKFFDPAAPGASTATAPDGPWIATLQPDIYMMYGMENAAGYDGFGLARYSQLAGDMKVWGELADAQRALGGESREIDLLNVRYLLARSRAATSTSNNGSTPTTAASGYSVANQVYGGQRFGDENLNLSPIGAGQRIAFNLLPIAADRVSLLTSLAWSEEVPDQTVVAKLRLYADNGENFDFPLRAGEHSSEWAYDRPDIRSRIKHRRAPVATSYSVEDAQAKYEAHTYVSTLVLPRKAFISRGEITVEPILRVPDLTLTVIRVAFAEGDHAYPVRPDWVNKDIAASEESQTPVMPEKTVGERWRHLTDAGGVAIFENGRTLPRAWLATAEFTAREPEQLSIIRTGKLPSGESWEPLKTVLVEATSGIGAGPGAGAGADAGSAQITKHKPNRIEVKTVSAAPAILVLSENHYPGWRAYLDGQSVDVMRVNYNQRGVALPAGNHLVEFIYRPKSVFIGLAISLLTLLTLLGWAAKKQSKVQS
jgi:hypothetical protein